MLGSHAPRPNATPKNATKQIIPAIIRPGNARKMMPNGSLLVSLAASVLSDFERRRAHPHPLQQLERALPLAVGRQPAWRFRQREAQHEDHQRQNADHRPDTAPMDDVAELQHEQGTDRPGPGAADELHQGDDASAITLGRVFRGVGEAQWLLGAQAEAREEPAHQQQGQVRHPGTGNRCEAEQQQIELVHCLAAEPVGEFPLPQRAQEQTDQGDTVHHGGA